MDPNTKKTCFFCGHVLPILLMTCSEQKKLEKQIMAAIEKAYRLGYRYFFSSGSLGFDTMAAKQIEDFRDHGHPEVEVHLIVYEDEKLRALAKQTEERGFPNIFSRADSVGYFQADDNPVTALRNLYPMIQDSSMGIFYYDYGINDHVAAISFCFRFLAEEGMRLVNLWDGFPEEIVFGPRAGPLGE